MPDAAPAEVLPTGPECFGPRPGIFSPLDLSIFILNGSQRETGGAFWAKADAELASPL